MSKSKNTSMNEFMQLYSNVPQSVRKWNKELSQISEAFGGDLGYHKQVSTAILLETAASHIDKVNAMMSMNEATQPADVGFMKTYAINLLSAVMPNLIAPDIVSMQPMQSSIGEIRFLEILYGSDKGQIKSGDVMMSPLAAGTSDHNYSSDQVVDEYVDATGTSVSATLAWLPVVPGTVVIKDDLKEYVDDGKGNITGTGVTSGTVNYTTGAVELTLAAAPTNNLLQFNYTYDNMNESAFPIAA